jgi:hypothetical protein
MAALAMVAAVSLLGHNRVHRDGPFRSTRRPICPVPKTT